MPFDAIPNPVSKKRLLVQKARDLIADPKHWDQGNYAYRTKEGYVFCAVGALNRARSTERKPREPDDWDGLSTIARAMGFPDTESLIEFNDTHSHAEVLARFDRAIAKL